MIVNNCAFHNRMELKVHYCLLAWSRDREKHLGSQILICKNFKRGVPE